MKKKYWSNRKNLRRVFILAAFALFVCLPDAAQAQTTEFAYQGQLQNGGSPAAGNYDFEFLLFDALSGGSQVGATLTKSSVAVASGIFSVNLDFGLNFPGDNRFLEIHVRQTGGGAFTPLAPRKAVSSIPYSVKSLSADNATTATTATTALNATNAVNATNAATAVTATTATNATQLNGQPAGFFQNAANLNSGTLDPSRLALPLILTGTSTTQIIRGENASNANAAAGVFGLATGISGQVVGVSGESSGSGGFGVQGRATSTVGQTYGVGGASFSTSGRGVYGIATATTGQTYGGRFESDSNAGIGVYGKTNATTGMVIGVSGTTESIAGFGVQGQANATSGQTYGVAGASLSTDGRGVYGIATATTGSTFGGRFESDSTSGTGVLGKANTATGPVIGVWGQSASTAGFGVQGQATATSGQNYGVAGSTLSTDGRGVYGIAAATSGQTYGGRFESDSTSGIGVYGRTSSVTGQTQGVRGDSTSPAGFGVLGSVSAVTGQTQGVRGDSISTSGIGVIGVVSAVTGQTRGVWGDISSGAGIAVLGINRGTSGTTRAIFGDVSSPDGTGVYGHGSYGVFGDGFTFGVFSNGNMGSSGAKPFRIDHPDDPANKYLLHYATESPEVINFYRGTVVLDSAGEAVVELPQYFAKINKDPSYTLTAVGAAMPMLHIAEEISDAALRAGEKAGPNQPAPACSFRIAGGVPGAKVSWRIEAVRNDLWVRTKGAAVEIEKNGLEKGTYQHPDLYGQPAEKGMNYQAPTPRPEPPPSLPVRNAATKPDRF